MPDINRFTTMPHTNTPSQILIASYFGNRILHLLSNKSKDIEQLSLRLTARKTEVDDVLMVMRFVLSQSSAGSSSQRPAVAFLRQKEGEGCYVWLVWFVGCLCFSGLVAGGLVFMIVMIVTIFLGFRCCNPC